MEEVLFRSEDFLTLGLTIAGFTRGRVERTSETKNLNRFRDFYYADPATCENLFQALGTTDILAARIEKPKPCYLLLALNYLKQYKTKFSLAGFLGVSENTAMKWAKVYVSKIQALKVAMVRSISFDIFCYSVVFVSDSEFCFLLCRYNGLLMITQ